MPAGVGNNFDSRALLTQQLVEQNGVVLLQQFGLASRRKTSLNIAVILKVNRSGRGLARAPFINLHAQGAGVEICGAMGNHADGRGRQKQLQMGNRHAVCLATQPIEPNEAERQHAVRGSGAFLFAESQKSPGRASLPRHPRVYQAEKECSRSERLLTRSNFHPRYSRSSRAVSCWRKPVRPAARVTTGGRAQLAKFQRGGFAPPGLAHEDSKTVTVAVGHCLHSPGEGSSPNSRR